MFLIFSCDTHHPLALPIACFQTVVHIISHSSMFSNTRPLNWAPPRQYAGQQYEIELCSAAPGPFLDLRLVAAPGPPQRPQKRLKKGRHCIKGHRLVLYRDRVEEEAWMCAKIEELRDRPYRVFQFDVLFASVYEVAELLGGVGLDLVLNIMPYLVHRGDSDNEFDIELTSEPDDDDLDQPEIVPDHEFVPSCPYYERCVLKVGQHSECEINAFITGEIQDRHTNDLSYQALLKLARINAHALNGIAPAVGWEKFDWTKCSRDSPWCELVDA